MEGGLDYSAATAILTGLVAAVTAIGALKLGPTAIIAAFGHIKAAIIN